MSATARKDVLLVIRAKDEGVRAISAASEALQTLFDTQAEVGSGAAVTGNRLKELVSAIGTVSKAYASMDTAGARAEGALERQQGTLQKTKLEWASVKAQIFAAMDTIASKQAELAGAKAAGNVDTKPLVASIKAAETALAQLQSQDRKLSGSIAAQEAAIGQSANSLAVLGTNANAAKVALVGVADAMGLEAVGAEEVDGALRAQLVVAEAVAASAREVGAAQTAMAAKAARIRAELNPLVALQEKYNLDLKEARSLHLAGALSAEELAQREKQLATELTNATNAMNRQGRGENGKVGLFGLKPYELTNLGYQVNDVATQLASGTSLAQTFAQQGGQILQLFPKLGAAMVGALSNPVILAAAATLGVVAAAIARAEAEAQRLRGFEGLLHSIGDNAAYSAGNLAEAAREIQHMGVAADEANATVTRFVRDGVDPARLTEFGRAARDLSDVLNIDMSDAASQVGAAFTGNYDAILRLQEATQFLTAAELEHIRTLFDEGRAAEARNRALELFRTRMDQAAQQARGPWAQAGRDLRRIWDDVIGAIAQAPQIQSMILGLNQLADALDRVAGAGGNVADNPPARLSAAAVQSRLSQLEHNLSMVQHMLDVHPNDRQLQAWKADVERRIANLRTSGSEAGDPRSAQSNAAQQESLEIARTHAQQMSLIDLQRQYEELTEADRRYGDTVNANQRIAIQGQIAFNNTLNETHNRQRALNAQLEAEARERARIASEQRQGAEANISRFARRVMAAESSNNNNARPRNADGSLASTALGQGQFLESTWLTLFRRYFPDQAARMGTQAILELRRNQEVSRRLIELYGRENAETLQRAGLAVTQFNLYLAHYLGGAGASNLLRAAANTPIVQAISGNAAPGSRADRDARRAVAANGELRRGGTAAGTLAAIHRRVDRTFGSSGPGADDQQAVLEQINQLEAQRAVQQDALNRRIDDENDERQKSTEHAQRLLGLSGDQIDSEARAFAIQSAVDNAQREAARQQLTIDDTRLARIRETVGAEYDIAHARERATRAVDESSSERQALIDRLNAARQAGDTVLAGQLQEKIAEVDARLRTAIDHAIQFWRAFNTPEARTAITGLEALRDSLGHTAQDLRQSAAQQPVDVLSGRRDALREQIDFFTSEGQMGIVAGLRQQLHALDAELLTAIDHLIEFYRTSTAPDAQQMLIHWQTMRQQIVAAGQEFRVTAGEIQQAFAGSLTSAAQNWAQAIGEGGNAIAATWDALRGFAADFLQKVASMVAEALALKAAMKLGFGNVAGGLNSLLNAAPLVAAGSELKSAGGTLTTAGGALAVSGIMWRDTAKQLVAAATMLLFANAMKTGSKIAGVFHAGGIAGTATTTRSVWPEVFANAARFHSGGIAGLHPGEIPAILQKGEEILTRSDSRHIFNGGGMNDNHARASNLNLKVVNNIDPSDLLMHSLATREGERVMMNFMKANGKVIKQLVNN